MEKTMYEIVVTTTTDGEIRLVQNIVQDIPVGPNDHFGGGGKTAEILINPFQVDKLIEWLTEAKAELENSVNPEPAQPARGHADAYRR